MAQQPPQPLYAPSDLRAAYELRYGWTGWPSAAHFSTDLIRQVLPRIATEWERDGIRLLESSLAKEQVLLTFSARPHVSPVVLAARVKGRLQHHCRSSGTSVAFSRKVSIRAIGHNHREH